MSEQTTAERPGFWTRLGRSLAWTLTTTLKVLFVGALLLVLVAGGWFITTTVDGEYREMQRRFALLEYAAEQTDQKDTAAIEALQAADERISALETALADQADAYATEQAQQAEQVAALEAQLEAQLESALQARAVLSDSIGLLNDVAAGLQSDVNTNVAELDALGGENDALQGRLVALETSLTQLDGDVAVLDSAVAGLVDAEAALGQMEITLTLFRAWDTVGRARLRLAEGNAGLAAADVNTALAVIDRLAPELATPVSDADADEVAPAPLTAIQTRLTLVADLLPEDTATAADDLDVIWGLLDELIATRLAAATAG
jgi:hypothetical protein